MQSNRIYDTEEAHNEIGQAIHDAKRRLLASHKSGVPLADATKTFFAEVENVTTRAAAKLSAPPAANDGPVYEAATLDALDREATSVDLEAVEREIENAKGALIRDLAGGMDSELAYLHFTIAINKRVGSEHLYREENDPVPREQGARTIKAAREVATDEQYHERTRGLLLETVDLTNFDGYDIARAHFFIDQLKTIDRIFRTCETLTERELDGATDYIIENMAGSAENAAICFLLDHMATLAANGNLEAVWEFAHAMGNRLFLRDKNAYTHYSLETWYEAGRAGITEYTGALAERKGAKAGEA